MIRTAEVLRFVKTGGEEDKVERLRKSEEQFGVGSRGTAAKTTIASTNDGLLMNRSSLMASPSVTKRNRSGYGKNRQSRDIEEFDLIKSHEKEALFLSERFGDRKEECKTL